jgi:serine acetyltransferase
VRALLETIRIDLAANSDVRGKTSMVLFRLASEPSFPRIVRGPIGLVYTVVVAWVFGIELPPGTRVGPGLRLNHSIGTVVNHDAVIGAHCDIKHGCTIGVRRSGEGSPILEDGVVLGAGTHVVGAIRLGTGSETGAGAVVLQDVPAGWIAVGNPARVIERRALTDDVTLSTPISPPDESLLGVDLATSTGRSQSATPVSEPGPGSASSDTVSPS